MTPRHEDLQRLLETLRGFEVAMLVTHGAGGELRARPMVISHLGDHGQLWFATSGALPKVTEIVADGRAVAIMQSDHLYVSVSGHVRSETDIDVVESHLSEDAERWLDSAAGRPTALVLSPRSAEIWDSTPPEGAKGKAVSLVGAAQRSSATTPPVKHVVIPFPPA